MTKLFNHPLEEALYYLQCNQLDHDEKYPKEITNLSLTDKYKHLTLHLAKYHGQLTQAMAARPANLNDIQRLTVDSFIIACSFANNLNVMLAEHLMFTPSHKSFSDYGSSYRGIHNIKKTKSFRYHVHVSYSLVVSNLATACEKLDHLESYNYKDTFIQNVVHLIKLTMALCNYYKIDLELAIAERRREVQRRSIKYAEA
jgi:hypothetical protein